jgi:hypothetical protein
LNFQSHTSKIYCRGITVRTFNLAGMKMAKSNYITHMEFYLIILRMQNKGATAMDAAKHVLTDNKFEIFKATMGTWATIQNSTKD